VSAGEPGFRNTYHATALTRINATMATAFFIAGGSRFVCTARSRGFAQDAA
jgi:hypothetical protein